MDQLEERDPPQSWPRAESRIMNRALRLPLGEKKAGMNCAEEGRAQNPTSVPLRSLASPNGGNDGTCVSEFLTSKIYTRKNLQPH